MKHGDWLVLVLVVLIALTAWAAFWLLSPSAKLRRRRRKSYSRIQSTSNRPSVRFSVRLRKK